MHKLTEKELLKCVRSKECPGLEYKRGRLW